MKREHNLMMIVSVIEYVKHDLEAFRSNLQHLSWWTKKKEQFYEKCQNKLMNMVMGDELLSVPLLKLDRFLKTICILKQDSVGPLSMVKARFRLFSENRVSRGALLIQEMWKQRHSLLFYILYNWRKIGFMRERKSDSFCRYRLEFAFDFIRYAWKLRGNSTEACRYLETCHRFTPTWYEIFLDLTRDEKAFWVWIFRKNLTQNS